jgi:ATP-dependent Lon protease
MKLTGQAGDVMKESSQIAWTYVQSDLKTLVPTANFFKKSQIHLHIPEGATPKDGPSAGVTMTTAIMSLILGQSVIPNLGMTGEITLTGQVLAVGGIKEKLIAAKRSGLKTILLPAENYRDYDELPQHIKKSLKVIFVKHYRDVFAIAFGFKKPSEVKGV